MTTADGQRPCLLHPAFGEPSDISLPSSTSDSARIPSQTSRKRKYAGYRGDGAHIGLPLNIQAHPSLLSSRAQQLIPRLLLPRSRLPLAYLDPESNQEGGREDQYSAKLFLAQIDILEEDQEEDGCSEPTILVAESTGESRLYAVEKLQNKIHALCRLGPWVTLELLERLQVGLMHRYPRQQLHIKGQNRHSSDEWWYSSAVKLDAEAPKDVLRAGAAPVVRLCLQNPAEGLLPSSPLSDKIKKSIQSEEGRVDAERLLEDKLREPEEILRTINLQYQEALYASKTSLAYFAKGPLSRARAAFQTNDGSGYDRSHLIQFLRTSILSLTVIDTKYHMTLPALIEDLPYEPLSEDEGAIVTAALKKKLRKSIKTKVRNNGLYPGEEVSVTRWWLRRDRPSSTCTLSNAREEETRGILFEQRARETQMQIILALEVLALEASHVTQSVEQDPTGSLARRDDESQKKKKKPRKLQDLHTFLDLLVDRLCIWQSVSTEENKAVSKRQEPTFPSAVNATDEKTPNGHLRQFCVDVVLPFYAARLPDLTTLLCQKLGGLKQASPKRPDLMKLATSQVPQKESVVMPRAQTRKPRRTLERVLTDERSASQKPPPPLSRSATDSILPRLKREESDTSLLSIPLNRVAMHKRYSQREVDLDAASQATDARLKKKAKIHQELQSAIAALKKPNPRMAVKELVEDAEKRAVGLNSRKSKHPVRSPFVQGVQVMATPSKNRQRNPFRALPRLPQANAAAPPEDDEEEIPHPGVSRILSSANKASLTSAKSSAQNSGDRFLHAIQQTPTRGLSKFSTLPNTSSNIVLTNTKTHQLSPADPESELASVSNGVLVLCKSRTANVDNHETPEKGRTISHYDKSEESGVEATPVKVQCNAEISCDVLLADLPSSLQQKAETSIYATLGWDDDVDELL